MDYRVGDQLADEQFSCTDEFVQVPASQAVGQPTAGGGHGGRLRFKIRASDAAHEEVVPAALRAETSEWPGFEAACATQLCPALVATPVTYSATAVAADDVEWRGLKSLVSARLPWRPAARNAAADIGADKDHGHRRYERDQSRPMQPPRSPFPQRSDPCRSRRVGSGEVGWVVADNVARKPAGEVAILVLDRSGAVTGGSMKPDVDAESDLMRTQAVTGPIVGTVTAHSLGWER